MREGIGLICCAAARSRVYWRSDRGRVKSRAEFAPE